MEGRTGLKAGENRGWEVKGGRTEKRGREKRGQRKERGDKLSKIGREGEKRKILRAGSLRRGGRQRAGGGKGVERALQFN